MKTVYLEAILIIVLVIISYTNQAHADYINPIKILDVQTQPDKVKIGSVFSINMTILNISPYPVFLTSGSCTPAFSVEFDSHAKQVYPNTACTSQGILQKIDPLEETTVSNANKAGIIFQAVQAGTANANITLPYFTKNQTSIDYSNIYYNASKSFQFYVYDTNETSASSNSIETPNGGWITPLQTTNSSGGKLDMHVEQGVDVSGKIMPPPVTENMESHQQFQTPLKQFKSGMPLEDIVCNNINGKQMYLFLRVENHNPICVTLDAWDALSRRGFVENNQTVINEIVLKKAKQFVLFTPTFITYGNKTTLSLDLTTCDLLVPQSCYPHAYFYVTHAGNYGNGTSTLHMTNQTDYHVMTMSIYDMTQIQCAVVDGIWDEKNQQPLDKNDPNCGWLYGYHG